MSEWKLLKINLAYMGILGFLVWQVEVKGPVAYFIKGILELALGQELSYN